MKLLLCVIVVLLAIGSTLVHSNKDQKLADLVDYLKSVEIETLSKDPNVKRMAETLRE
jgi:hypothetical protein